MNRRNRVLVISTAIMVALFVAVLIVSCSPVRTILLYLLLINAVAVVIYCIFLAWSQLQANRIAHRSLRREFEVERALNRETIRNMDQENQQMRRIIFGHMAKCTGHTDQHFDSALEQLLIEGAIAEHRDG